MGMMTYREANQVNWFGTRPGHNGTQVLESLRTAVVGVTPLYTVPVGVTLYLTFAYLAVTDTPSVVAYMMIYNAVPAEINRLLGFYRHINFPSCTPAASFWPPIELPTGYSIRLSQSVNAQILGSIHGWVE